ncbi:hypothetical protein DI270_022830 [Microbispora triticiradicis]|uniref:Ni/Fe hydrogenase subunit alpha n=1 Tax=Microbispora triticiradicis TaxID=2200763 RepID=A0ABX9LFK4_9ACTN|nr:nickel-dependent hydrogenase large subunit [Microbispora triticiradicis]RGA02751.1 hypothetical protein DI270_022830 [Microbispora triticiradicis]GLW25940.1 hypothetical protein Mame01_59820 [Microbispora amethystogenes]
MTHKTVRIGGLTRVEGEGGLVVHARDGRITGLELRIYEPPRFFEALLRGRGHTEPPDITARICGICPVAYQMSACQAIEAACGVEMTGPLRDLRLLLYYGEWIESHALHVHLLHAPDFLGYDSGIAMAADRRDLVERGLALKKAGNELIAVVGGRPIHRVPARAELAPVAERLRRARDDAVATVAWVAAFDLPDVEHDDLRDLLAPRLAPGLDPPEAELAALCERAIRNHDPCISCSAHFLDFHLDRG